MLAGLASQAGIPGPIDFAKFGLGLLQRKNERAYSDKLYQRQKADIIEFRDYANEYNTPANQMSRLSAAGLNPALMYGQGNTGNMGGSPIPETTGINTERTEMGSSKFDILGPLLATADLKVKAAQANNLTAQAGVIQQEERLKSIMADRAQFDLLLEKEVLPFSAEARKQQTRKLTIDNDVTLNRDSREAAINSSHLNEAIERMRSMRQSRAQSRAEVDRINKTIELMRKDGTLKDIEINLRNQGINPNDPAWQREVIRLLNKIFGGESSGLLSPLQDLPVEMQGFPGAKY